MLLTLALSAFAQVNHESLLLKAQKAGWGAGGAVNAVTVSGNLSFLNLGGEAYVHGRTSFRDAPNDQFWFRDRVLLLARYNSQYLFGNRIQLQRLIHLRYTRMVVHRFGVELFAQEQNDQILILDHRIVAGIEPRVVLIHTEPFGLWAATGYMFEYEDRTADRLGPTEAERVLSHRWTTYVSLNWHPTKHVSVTNTGYVQPKLTDFSDTHLVDELELAFSVGKVFSLTSGMRIRYDTNPPAALKPLDLLTHHGFRVDI